MSEKNRRRVLKSVGSAAGLTGLAVGMSDRTPTPQLPLDCCRPRGHRNQHEKADGVTENAITDGQPTSTLVVDLYHTYGASDPAVETAKDAIESVADQLDEVVDQSLSPEISDEGAIYVPKKDTYLEYMKHLASKAEPSGGRISMLLYDRRIDNSGGYGALMWPNVGYSQGAYTADGTPIVVVNTRWMDAGRETAWGVLSAPVKDFFRNSVMHEVLHPLLAGGGEQAHHRYGGRDSDGLGWKATPMATSYVEPTSPNPSPGTLCFDLNTFYRSFEGWTTELTPCTLLEAKATVENYKPDPESG